MTRVVACLLAIEDDDHRLLGYIGPTSTIFNLFCTWVFRSVFIYLNKWICIEENQAKVNHGISYQNCNEQKRESPEGFSKWIVWKKYKFPEKDTCMSLQVDICKSEMGRDQVSGGVRVPCQHPVANVLLFEANSPEKYKFWKRICLNN